MQKIRDIGADIAFLSIFSSLKQEQLQRSNVSTESGYLVNP
jgi:hypothetical protein